MGAVLTYIAATKIHESGTFFDIRLTDNTQFPIVAHYATVLHLTLSDRERDDLIEYLKSLYRYDPPVQDVRDARRGWHNPLL